MHVAQNAGNEVWGEQILIREPFFPEFLFFLNNNNWNELSVNYMLDIKSGIDNTPSSKM
jgi:hypothetical protein